MSIKRRHSEPIEEQFARAMSLRPRGAQPRVSNYPVDLVAHVNGSGIVFVIWSPTAYEVPAAWLLV